MTAGPPVRLERRGAVAHVVLDRPAKLNALDLPALAALRRAMDDVADDHAVRAVVLRGEGRAFCTGVDLALTGEALEDSDAIDAVVSQVHATLAAVERSPVPVIAAVHGMACAGGLELLLACDLAIASDDARFADYHARYGLFPGGGASQRLPRLVGERRAKWLLLSGEWIDAAEALRWGLVNEVVAPDDLLARADEVAQLLARRSPVLADVIKETVREGAGADLGTALAAERPRFLRYMTGRHARVGLDAFSTRSEPDFPDR